MDTATAAQGTRRVQQAKKPNPKNHTEAGREATAQRASGRHRQSSYSKTSPPSRAIYQGRGSIRQCDNAAGPDWSVTQPLLVVKRGCLVRQSGLAPYCCWSGRSASRKHAEEMVSRKPPHRAGKSGIIQTPYPCWTDRRFAGARFMEM